MDIYIYRDADTDSIRLPVNPSEIVIESPQKNETFETIGQGELKLIGLEGARKLTLSSFFPVKQYKFRRDFRYNGMEYIKKIKRWRQERLPVYILIDDLDIYFQSCVNNVSYSIKDGSGDIYYSIELEEFKIPEIKQTTTSNTETTTVAEQTSTVPLSSEYGKITGTNVNIRTGPSLGYSIIGNCNIGDLFKLYRIEGEWWQVDYRGTVAYINSKYVKGE